MRRCSKEIALGLMLALTACQDSLARRETIDIAAGDAIAQNKAIHIIDPWPASSANTAIPTNARRVADAIERYESRAPAGVAASGAPVFAPVTLAPPPAAP